MRFIISLPLSRSLSLFVLSLGCSVVRRRVNIIDISDKCSVCVTRLCAYLCRQPAYISKHIYNALIVLIYN